MALRGIGRTGIFCSVVSAMMLGGYATGEPAAAPNLPLVDTIRAAKSQFHPITKADSQDAMQRLVAAVAQLDERLNAAGKKGQNWRKYLQLDDLQAQLQRQDGPDMAVLGTIYVKLAAGYEGLELKWFALVRQTLRQYLEVAGAVDNPAVKAAYEEHIDALAKQIETWTAQPTTDGTQEIADSLAWIENARQAPGLVQAVRAQFGRPNFTAHIGVGMLAMGIASPVDETEPIDDVIMKTVIHGSGRTVGQTDVRLVPDPCSGVFDTILLATNKSQNVGFHKPVCIYTCGATGIGGCIRFWIDAFGLHAYPAVSQVETHSTITDIRALNGSQLIERFAWRRALKQEPMADAIASSHAQQRVNGRMDEQASTAIEQANANYEAKVRRPLGDRLAFPQQLGFSTTAEAIHVSGVEAADDQLAAPTAAPSVTPQSEISVSVHESMANNLATTVLSGLRLTDDMSQRTVKELLGRVPDRLQPDQAQDQEPFTIVFARRQPISVTFADNGFSVTIRGREFFTADRSHPAMNITASYKFVKTDSGFKAVRQGDLDIFAPGTLPGSGKQRGLRQQVIWTVLQRRLGKIFQPELPMQGFTAKAKSGSAIKFVPVEVVAGNGWLTIGWSRTQPAATATASSE